MALDSFGKTRMTVGDEGFCNYLYQGQSCDRETGLAYNRFRYYSPEEGNYISQDPIGLASGNPTLYGYVYDTNRFVDPLGLMAKKNNVCMNSALADVPARGVHVNDCKNSMHVEVS